MCLNYITASTWDASHRDASNWNASYWHADIGPRPSGTRLVGMTHLGRGITSPRCTVGRVNPSNSAVYQSKGRVDGSLDEPMLWLNSIRNDLSVRKLSGEDAQDRAKWTRLTRHIDPT